MVALGAVWADVIVMPAPGFDDDLGFFEGVKDLSIEQLVSQTSVEAFVISVLPWATRFDKGGPNVAGFPASATSLAS